MSGAAAEANRKNARIYWITVLQIVSMILIVLSHSVPDNMTTPRWMVSTVSYLQNAGLISAGDSEGEYPPASPVPPDLVSAFIHNAAMEGDS